MKNKLLPNDFEFTACDNKICINHKICKRYVMFAKYEATDIKTGSGTKDNHCKRYLPLVELKN